jgi:hypothetical protein
MAELDKEIEKYKDFMRIDFEEEYLNLPKKTYEISTDALNVNGNHFAEIIQDDQV